MKKNYMKRILTLALSALLALSVFPTAALAEEKADAINLTIRGQNGGAFVVDCTKVYQVSAMEAEEYGFSDQVKGGVSALDACVALHKEIFGSSFTKETASEYLAETGGYCSKIFGITTSANGFFVNGGTPNDGTESPWGGYNGTTLENTELKNGDVVDFFIYQDQSYWSDEYSYINAPAKMEAGKRAYVSVNAVMAMNGYLYKDPAEMKAAANPVDGATLNWIDENGEFTVAGKTNKEGKVSIKAPENIGTYLLVAVGNDDEPLVMNPVTVQVVEIDGVKLLEDVMELKFQTASAKVASSVVYNGKAATPKVSMELFGNALVEGKDFKVTYSNNVNVGTAKVAITGIGDYKGQKTLSFNILPQKVTLTKAVAGKKKMTVKWTGAATNQATGYQICYSTVKSMAGAKQVTVKSVKTGKYVIKKLKTKKKCYAQVRVYKTIGKTDYYSAWSNVKAAKVK